MTEDIKLEVIKMTQDTLGKYIKKPPLTEKLLKKPPFRFLHDIITAIIRGTGFLSGLYSDAEMISENIKDRDMKIAFLQKLIDCITIVTEKKLDARPSKIVAGLEPTKTNELLQAIGIAISRKLDSSIAVSKLTGEKNIDKKRSKIKDNKKEIHNSKESIDNKIKQSSSNNITKKTQESKLVRKTSEDKANKIKESPRTKTDKTKESPRTKTDKTKESPRIKTDKTKESPRIKTDKTKESPQTKTDKTKESPRTKKIKTKENPLIKTKENHNVNKIIEKQEEYKPESPKMSPKEEIIETKMETVSPVIIPEISQISPDISSGKLETIPNTEKFVEQAVQEILIVNKKEILKPQEDMISRPKTSLRPPSVRPSSARPGAPRLKDRNDIILPPDEIVSMGKVNVIVENFNAADEEETVVMEAPLEEISHPELPSIKPNLPAEKGHLVAQILEQIEDSEPQRKIEIEWESTGGKRNREIANREMQKLRESIQTLTRAANPLGKLMNFLQEDVDSMRSELKMWIEINGKLSAEIKTQEKLNNDSITPLKTQLNRLDEEINKQHELISLTQANVLKNEQKIKILLNRN